MISNRTLRQIGVRLSALFVVACTSAHAPSSYDGTSATEMYAPAPNNFKISLVDAPNAELKSVFVNVARAELRVSRAGKDGRLLLAPGLGPVDLLKLQNGLALPLAKLNLPEDTTISQIRLVLQPDGNYAVKADGSTCALATPSAHQSGVKLIIRDGIVITKGYSYAIVADFDAKKSVVMQGNGGCLLKPVIKLKSASRITLPPGEDLSGENGGAVEEPVASEEDGMQSGDDTGFEPAHGENGGAGETEPPFVDPSTL